MFDPIQASKNIREEFISYISTNFHLADREVAQLFKETLGQENVIAKGPYLDMTDAYESGQNIRDLIEQKELSELFTVLEPGIPEGEKEIKLLRPLYRHQEQAIRKINQGKNLVVTTGTGSGKTECFLLPIINHLLREIEAGSLTNGVRAILIYPMNALANDQMKRLRLILKQYPAITFGVYNSSTQYTDENGIAEYGRLFKDDMNRPQKPLPNEVISRKSMQDRPPHILITNYAMLEYMLLRPKDDAVFSGSALKFLVLDEAHIYKGATGIETAMLMRRLKARVQHAENIQHILTSATLGGKEADEEIVSFAKRLCGAEFEEDDIIRSETIIPPLPAASKDIPFELFERLANPDTAMNTILDAFGIDYDADQRDEEILYDLVLSSTAYKHLRQCAIGPMTVQAITSAMREKMPLQVSDLVNFICVASKASKNKTTLMKARYHMFVRALEGAYFSMFPQKQVFLTRHNQIVVGGETFKVFEMAVCDDCGRMGVAGKIVNNHLEFASNRNDEKLQIFLLKTQDEQFDQEDYDDAELIEDIEKEDYVLCAKCGEIHHKSQIMNFSCGHGLNYLIPVRRAERKGVRNEFRCPGCDLGHLRLFYIGYDAATAVLGAELFEQLPETEKVLKSKKVLPTQQKNLFSLGGAGKPKADQIRKKRQFLIFSDSRSEAAYYACYMTAYYAEFLRRRALWHVIDQNRADLLRDPWEIQTLVDELTAYFDANRTFEPMESDRNSSLTPISRRQAWIAVLNEMVNARRSTSLVSLGVLDFVYKGNSEEIMTTVAEARHQRVSDVHALFNLLVMDIVHNGAIESEEESFTNDEREYIYYTPYQRRFKKCKENGDPATRHGWIPRVRESGKAFRNGRVSRIMKTMNCSENDATSLLSDYWDFVLEGGGTGYGLTPEGDGEFFFSTKCFVVVVGDDVQRPIYRCQKCGRTTMINCKDQCTTLKCDGHLERISHQSIIEGNHFAQLYASKLMSPLHIKEHTAQLGRAEQQKYQELFVNKDINALSCSTTFEMGVDVGDLETVYLRNMPPSPANYVQRAGRAGRSIHAAAYALTYSKLSSHDLVYFEHPEKMISGKIGVPLFSISNEKIVLRHIFAVAISDFFAENPDVYNQNDADVLLNQDGYERLVMHLEQKPERLWHQLLKSIPKEMHSALGIGDWSWVEKLVGENGALSMAVMDFKDTVAWYEKEIKRFKHNGDLQGASKSERQLKDFRRSSEDLRGKNDLIEFLVRNNVLPKYGFPVDTVELSQGLNVNTGKKLRMDRDLQLAISEYAPGAQVIADGKLYTSRYIRKRPQSKGQDWEEVYIAKCDNPSCQTWNHRHMPSSQEGEKCVSCGHVIEKSKWRVAIEPRKGFIAESKPKDVPLRKPERIFRSEDCYIGDPTRKVMVKRTFRLPKKDEKVQIENSANDSLLVLCNDHFYVCNHCGYAISATSVKGKKNFSSYAKSTKEQHQAPWGAKCDGKLVRKDLCHTFKTDVVKITFATNRAKNKSTMLSVLYALLEAMANVFDIERTDIKGCLHKIRFERSMIYEVILYDAVAGGAGYVRRLAAKDCDMFQKVIAEAIRITKNCNCSPSCYNCLRNYYNQTIHDLLNREAAYAFLEHYLDSMEMIADDQFEDIQEHIEESFSEDEIVISTDDYCLEFQNWNDFAPMVPEEYLDAFSEMENTHIPIPSDAYCKIKIKERPLSFEALFLWKEKKVMIFDDDHEKIDIQGWLSLFVREVTPEKLSELLK